MAGRERMREPKNLRLLIMSFFVISFGAVLVASILIAPMRVYLLDNMEINIEKRLNMTAEKLRSLVSIEELNQFRMPQDMSLPAYQALREDLLQFALENDILYAYFIRPQGNFMYYIADSDQNEATREGLDSPPFRIEEEPLIAYALEGQTVFLGLGNYTLGWSGLTTSYAPMYGPQGEVAAIAGVDLLDQSILRAMRMVNNLAAVQIISVMVIFISSLVSFLSFRREALSAASANAAKSSFLAAMSHEIRSSMNAVIGLSEIELMGPHSETSTHNITQIHRSGTYLLGIINDILDISKIEAGGLELKPHEYDSASLINDTISIHRVQLGNKPIELVLELEDDFPSKLYGDELRVSQIVGNILSNAIKYTKEGRITITVSWRPLSMPRAGEAGRGQLGFTIRDTGIGIRQEELGKLFTGYSRLDYQMNQSIEGTGLGLVIAKTLSEMMGGTINVESEYGKGSVFTVELIQGIYNPSPLGPDTVQALKKFTFIRETSPAETRAFAAPEGKILLVDDRQTNLLVGRGLLKPYGIQVDTAASGPEAIELVKQKRRSGDKQYDLILMDYMMPGMDGVETAKLIRAWEGSSSESPIPIVALTANAQRGMKEYFEEQGFQAYITKPIDPLMLGETIEALLPEHKIRSQTQGNVMKKPGLQLHMAHAMEAQLLDSLNHYRSSFRNIQEGPGDTVPGASFDPNNLQNLMSIIDSFISFGLNTQEQEDAQILREAISMGDIQKIALLFPSFYGSMEQRISRRDKSEAPKEPGSDGTDECREELELLNNLKHAMLAEDIQSTEEIMGKLGTIQLGPLWRELFFLLYDLLLEGETEKALGAISLWERLEKRG
ncbi:MAG: ATP-binding protein [Treponema sp.]|nr:ATP-binding protein [Treponema sp.]